MWGVFSRQQLSVGKASHLFGQPTPFFGCLGSKAFFTPLCYLPAAEGAVD
jgi:hypothetical protein